MKVLLVLDDVKDSDQLEDLIGTHSNFGQGSRIIVNNRDKQVLKIKNANADEIYQVKEMDYQDSLQLFCLFAFKGEHPIEPYASLSEKVLDYAKGVPIALKVLGKFLQGRKKEAWESQLQKLEKFPDPKVFTLLKLSYDGLDDDQKDIFLDIACFYKGRGGSLWRPPGATAPPSFYINFILYMLYQLIRCRCSGRLWNPYDIYDVLSKNKVCSLVPKI
jgi:hypothetical protein